MYSQSAAGAPKGLSPGEDTALWPEPQSWAAGLQTGSTLRPMKCRRVRNTLILPSCRGGRAILLCADFNLIGAADQRGRRVETDRLDPPRLTETGQAVLDRTSPILI